jgi:Uncharacterized alpha/beta hydrolase domain (DUF2235)
MKRREKMPNEKETLQASQACNRDVPNTPPSSQQDCRDVVNISLFFDGTGNNEDKDEGDKKWSNVARLKRAALELVKKGMPNYVFYISGVGTPFNGKAISADDAKAIVGEDSKRGGGFGAGGDRRLNFGMDNVNDALKQVLQADAQKLANTTKSYADKGAAKGMDDIAKAVGAHRLTKVINLSIFGFSRGAALARAFSNQFIEQYQQKDGSLKYKGFPVRIVFMGLFDTVASFGLPTQNLALPWEEKNLILSHKHVERAVHYVAAHELRFSFPVDLIRKNGQLKSGWIETVYPGAHSDVGGGYHPKGGESSQGLTDNYARIPMKDMMSEAVKCGVRMLSYDGVQSVNYPLYTERFEIHPQVQDAYSAYMAQVKPSGSVEQQMQQHMTAFYAAYGTLGRQGYSQTLPGHLGAKKFWYTSMSQEVFHYRVALKTARVTSGLLPAVSFASGAYAVLVQPQKWQLDAYDSTTNNPITAFIAQLVHDSKAGFEQGAEPFSYFRQRGVAESSRNVLAAGLSWLDNEVSAAANAAIKIYHEDKKIVVEKWVKGKLVVEQTYKVGEKFVVDHYHEGEKMAVETYHSAEKVVIETTEQVKQLAVSTYHTVNSTVSEGWEATKKEAATTATKTKQAVSNASSAAVKTIEKEWDAAKVLLGF